MARRDEGYFASRDGTRLFWRQDAPDDREPLGWLGVVHGYGDHAGRYALPIEYWVRQGFGVLSFDYRGHGKADGARADVASWDLYLDDLEAFVARLNDAAGSRRKFLVAHSHGGLMATHLVARRPQARVDGVVLSAPFYAFAFEPPRLQVLGARLIRRVLPGLSISNGLKAPDLSRDEAWQKETMADPLYLHTTTPRWFFACLEAQQRLVGIGAKVTLPVMVVTGGADPIASSPAARALFETFASTDKAFKEYPGSRHEVLMELGRQVVWDDISSWISAHL